MSRFTKHALFGLLCLLVAAALAGAAAPAGRSAQGPIKFSGQATVLSGRVLGSPLPCIQNGQLSTQSNCRGIVDTGRIEDQFGGNEGQLDDALLRYPQSLPAGVPDVTNGAASATVLHATVVAHGNQSTARACAAEFSLDVSKLIPGANANVGGALICARVVARCDNGVPSATGDVHIVDLTVNGQKVDLSSGPVTIKDVLTGASLGTIEINTQKDTSGSDPNHRELTVNALHIVLGTPVTGTVADITVATATADVTCGQLLSCPGGHQFVTSGGFINDPVSAERDHFAAAGRDTGIVPQPWGHVMWKPASGGDLHVKNPYSLIFFRDYAKFRTAIGNGQYGEFTQLRKALAALDANSANFDGAAILYWTANGQPQSAGNPIAGEVLLVDMGEPGNQPKGYDFFEIAEAQGAAPLLSVAGGLLQGGNIQMHGKC